jgi:hypothetical protein
VAVRRWVALLIVPEGAVHVGKEGSERRKASEMGGNEVRIKYSKMLTRADILGSYRLLVSYCLQ